MKSNIYIPYPVTINEIEVENDAGDIKTFKLIFDNPDDEMEFRYLPGQFAQLSVFGYGECPIGIASSPTEAGYLLFSVKRMGTVTTELHNSLIGRRIGVRGPLGKSFPWEQMEGKNIIVVGGGFAFTTLRSAIQYMLCLQNRRKFKEITVIYGARNPGELMYKGLLREWQSDSKSLKMIVTVDKGDDDWKGRVGLVPIVLKEIKPPADNSVALVCGPPIMIKFTIPVLKELGFTDENIILSLEMRMKCGIGKCGRCNIGHKYVCVDGPVFTLKELECLPEEY